MSNGSSAINGTAFPTLVPTISPTVDPTLNPTYEPTIDPLMNPSFEPSKNPTFSPTYNATVPISTTAFDDSFAQEPETIQDLSQFLVIGSFVAMVVLLLLCIYQKWFSSKNTEVDGEKKLEMSILTFEERKEQWEPVQVDWSKSFLNTKSTYGRVDINTILNVLEDQRASINNFKRDPVAGDYHIPPNEKVVLDFVPDSVDPWKAQIVFCPGELPWIVLKLEEGGLFNKKKVERGWHIIRVNKVQVNSRSKSSLQKILKSDKGCTIQFEQNSYEDSFKLLDFHGLVPEVSEDKLVLVDYETLEMDAAISSDNFAENPNTLSPKIKKRQIGNSGNSRSSFRSMTDSSTFYHYGGLPLGFLGPGQYVTNRDIEIMDEETGVTTPLHSGTKVQVDEIHEETCVAHLTSPAKGWIQLRSNNTYVLDKPGRATRESLSDLLYGNVTTPEVLDSMLLDADSPSFSVTTPPLQAPLPQHYSSGSRIPMNLVNPTPPSNVYGPRILHPESPSSDEIRKGSFVRTDSGSVAQVLQIAEDEGGVVAAVRKKGRIEQFRNLKSLRSLDEFSVESIIDQPTNL